MFNYSKNDVYLLLLRKALSLFVCTAFVVTSLLPSAYAQSVFNLPQPGQMVGLSDAFAPVVLKGVSIHPEDPLLFDFIVDNGHTKLAGQALTDETTKLVKYFLAGLAVPEKDLWVNLSPVENDRIMEDDLSHTDVGREMLAQDYLLKQVTSSLMYPEKDLGRAFWAEVYKRSAQQFGNVEIPVDTFNKVWITPDEATVYQNGNNAFVAGAHLKVMLESDYEAMSHQKDIAESPAPAGDLSSRSTTVELAKDVVRQIILPVLEKEVNEGRNFASLRQVFQSMILAGWYKNALKNSLINQVYSNTNKVEGIDIADKDAKQKVYAQYLEAYQKGVYNYIREEFDQTTQETTPRKYFAGGIVDMSQSPQVKGQKDLTEKELAFAETTTGNTLNVGFRMETQAQVPLEEYAGQIVQAADILAKAIEDQKFKGDGKAYLGLELPKAELSEKGLGFIKKQMNQIGLRFDDQSTKTTEFIVSDAGKEDLRSGINEWKASFSPYYVIVTAIAASKYAARVVENPQDPLYGSYAPALEVPLTGLTDEDIAKISSWARGAGLQFEKLSRTTWWLFSSNGEDDLKSKLAVELEKLAPTDRAQVMNKADAARIFTTKYLDAAVFKQETEDSSRINAEGFINQYVFSGENKVEWLLTEKIPSGKNENTFVLSRRSDGMIVFSKSYSPKRQFPVQTASDKVNMLRTLVREYVDASEASNNVTLMEKARRLMQGDFAKWLNGVRQEIYDSIDQLQEKKMPLPDVARELIIKHVGEKDLPYELTNETIFPAAVKVLVEGLNSTVAPRVVDHFSAEFAHLGDPLKGAAVYVMAHKIVNRNDWVYGPMIGGSFLALMGSVALLMEINSLDLSFGHLLGYIGALAAGTGIGTLAYKVGVWRRAAAKNDLIDIAYKHKYQEVVELRKGGVVLRAAAADVFRKIVEIESHPGSDKQKVLGFVAEFLNDSKMTAWASLATDRRMQKYLAELKDDLRLVVDGKVDEDVVRIILSAYDFKGMSIKRLADPVNNGADDYKQSSLLKDNAQNAKADQAEKVQADNTPGKVFIAEETTVPVEEDLHSLVQKIKQTMEKQNGSRTENETYSGKMLNIAPKGISEKEFAVLKNIFSEWSQIKLIEEGSLVYTIAYKNPSDLQKDPELAMLKDEVMTLVNTILDLDNAALEIQGGIDLGQGNYLKVIATDAAGMPQFDPAEIQKLQKDLRGLVPVPVGLPVPVTMRPLLGLDTPGNLEGSVAAAGSGGSCEVVGESDRALAMKFEAEQEMLV